MIRQKYLYYSVFRPNIVQVFIPQVILSISGNFVITTSGRPVLLRLSGRSSHFHRRVLQSTLAFIALTQKRKKNLKNFIPTEHSNPFTQIYFY